MRAVGSSIDWSCAWSDSFAERAFDRQRSLTNGGQAKIGRQNHVGRLCEHARSRKARRGQDDCIALPFVKLTDACLDVAPERHEAEVGALTLQLNHAPAGGRADFRAAFQRGQIGSVDGDQNVTRVFADGHAQDAHPCCQRNVARNVFQGVDREVRLATDDHRLHLAHEQPLAAD